jgi:hypothetical protein
MTEILFHIFTDILADLGAHQIEDLIRKISENHDPAALLASGGGPAEHFMNSLTHHGIALSDLTTQDWDRIQAVFA